MSETQDHLSQSAMSTQDAPHIALVGCGALAEEYYLPALARHPAVLQKLILVDRNESRAQQLAKRFGAKTCQTDYRQILAAVDGAIIAVPTHLHHPISIEFLSQGVPVLCEKPLAETADRAREIIEQAEQAKVVLAVNYLQRMIPVFAKVKELLDSNALGQPRVMKYCVGEEFKWPTVSGFYFNSPTSSRGVLRDRGAHVIDHICWWLGGKPRLISSQNDSFGGSEAVAHVQFEYRGCTGEVKLSWLTTFPSRFVIICENGAIEGDVYDYNNISVKAGTDRPQRIKLQSEIKTKVDIACQIVSNFVDTLQMAQDLLSRGKT
jgi:UDP-N-acetylglucosamine 3-dehydrogenase